MNLRNKQFCRSVLELIFQNPEAANNIFNEVYQHLDFDKNSIMKELEPLINYVCDDYFDIMTAIKLGQECIKNETLRKIFEATILNNVEISYYDTPSARAVESVIIKNRS